MTIAALAHRQTLRTVRSATTLPLVTLSHLQQENSGALLSGLACLVFGILGIVAGVYLRSGKSLEGGEKPIITPRTNSLSSPLRIWALASLYLPYGYSLAAQGLFLAPLEAQHLMPQSAAFMLGSFAILCGVAQLVGPEAGYWSDSYRSPFGRRRPPLIISGAFLTSCTCGLWWLSHEKMTIGYLIVFFFQQLAWNVAQSTQNGFIPDLVHPDTRGFAGGACAANILVGAVLAFACNVATSHLDFHYQYALMAGLIFICCGIVCLVGDEVSSEGNEVDSANAERSLVERLRHHYWYDTAAYPGFTLLLLTKTLYCALVVVKGFLLFFVQDTFHLPGNGANRQLVSALSGAAEVSAAVAALCCTWAFKDEKPLSSPREADGCCVAGGRSVPAIVAGSIWMGLLWLGPIALGHWVMNSEKTTSQFVDAYWNEMMMGMLVWGVGQGMYLASDQALSFILLPDDDEASRYLGFNSVCAFVGATVGGVIAGGLLGFIGNDGRSEGYAYPGYVAIFIFAGVLSLLIAGVGAQIRFHLAVDAEV